MAGEGSDIRVKLSAQGVEVELVLQTRNRQHVQEVLQRLTSAGLDAQVL